MDYKSLTDLIAAYRAETAAKSIAPENTGYILQTIIDLLNESVSELDRELSASLESYVADLQNTDADLSAKLQALAEAVNKLSASLENKQDKLVPGENIANVNGASLLDGGNIEISADGGIIKSLSTAEILEAIAEAENE